jgi:DNA-binding transcriptional ArsR family regulator
MDSNLLSARQAANALGTSAPRVLRALAQSGVAVPVGQRARLTGAQVAELGARLGRTPAVAGLSRTEVMVAAALARSPLGLVSRRAVARRAGLSPTAAGRALESLREKGLVRIDRRSLPGRRAHDAEVIVADLASPSWQRIAGELARVQPPQGDPPAAGALRVPARLDYLFWDTADAQRDVRRAGGYIARRLLQAEDPEGLAWGAENLSPEDWRHAAGTRGVTARARALALNLAAGTDKSTGGVR